MSRRHHQDRIDAKWRSWLRQELDDHDYVLGSRKLRRPVIPPSSATRFDDVVRRSVPPLPPSEARPQRVIWM